MWWLAILSYIAAAALAPKAVGIASLVLIAAWVIWRIAKIFSLQDEESAEQTHATAADLQPAQVCESVADAPTAAIPVQPLDTPEGVHESDEEFLARQRAANFQHDPTLG